MLQQTQVGGTTSHILSLCACRDMQKALTHCQADNDRVSNSVMTVISVAAFGPLINTTGDQWDKIFDTVRLPHTVPSQLPDHGMLTLELLMQNVKASFMLSKEVIPIMQQVP